MNFFFPLNQANLQVYNFIAFDFTQYKGEHVLHQKTKKFTISKRDRLIYSHRLFLFLLGSLDPSSGVYKSAVWAAVGCWEKGRDGAGTGGGGAINGPGGGTGGGTMNGLAGGAAAAVL